MRKANVGDINATENLFLKKHHYYLQHGK